MAFLLLIALHSGASDSIEVPRVSRFTILGNEAFSTGELTALRFRLAPTLLRKPRFGISGLRRDTSLLAQFYRSNGFLRVRVMADTVIPDKAGKRVKITVRINEGLVTKVAGVRMEGISGADQALLLKSSAMETGKPLRMAGILKDLQDFRGRLADSGYLEASVTYEVALSGDSLLAEVRYIITRGPIIRISAVEMIGLSAVRPIVVTRRLRLSPEEVLTRPKLREATGNLYATGLFGFVMLGYDSVDGGYASSDSSRVLRVRLTEAKFFKATLTAGYQTYEQARGSLGLHYSNFFGLGIRGHASGYANFINQGGELGGTVPWLFGIPLDFDATVSTRRRDEPRIHLAGTFYQWHGGFTYLLSDRWRALLSHRLETSRLTVIPPVLPEFVGAPLTHSVGFEAAYDSRDDLFDTRQGAYADGAVEVSGLSGAASNHFVRFQTEGRLFLTLRPTVILASALYAGIAVPYGVSAALPIQDRFYLGGSTVMRGFGEKMLGPDSAGVPTGGTLYLAGNLAELRFWLYKWIWGDLFLDAGNLWDVKTRRLGDFAAELKKLNLFYNAGIGIRAHLPIVVLSLDLGFKLNKRPADQDPAALHFKVGHSF